MVGGWVRDRLLGRPARTSTSRSTACRRRSSKALLETLGPVNTVGESFTVYKVLDVDVSLPRRESKTGRGHRGVRGHAAIRTCRRKKRRGAATSPSTPSPGIRSTDVYLDPFDGRRDLLERRVLRAVDRAHVRRRQPARAARHSVRRAFRARDGCRARRRSAASIPLDDLPAERVWGEIEKLLLLAERPSLGFALALELGVIDRLFPELKALVGCPQEPEWHPEGDVWVHTLLVIDRRAAGSTTSIARSS